MKIAKLETFDTRVRLFREGHGGYGRYRLGADCRPISADITAEVFHRQIAPHALGTDVAGS